MMMHKNMYDNPLIISLKNLEKKIKKFTLEIYVREFLGLKS